MSWSLATMDDVRAATGANGMRVASTFAGCGGSSTGYRLAGFDVVYACDYAETAAECYQANASPSTVVEAIDVRALDLPRFERLTGIGRGELDLLDGSPPCQPFSTAGARQKNWSSEVARYGEDAQVEVDLTADFARLVDQLEPRAFVVENVAALAQGVAIGHMKRFLTLLRAAGPGYRVRTAILDASWLGVPQKRKRFFAVGIREDLGIDPVMPRPWKVRTTLGDALAAAGTVAAGPSALVYRQELAKLTAGAKLRIDETDQPAPTVTGKGLSGKNEYGLAGTAVVARKFGSHAADELDIYPPGDPAPTVTANGIAGRSNTRTGTNYAVAGTALLVKEFFGPINKLGLRTHPADEPSPTISGHGIAHAGINQGGLACAEGWRDPETGNDLRLTPDNPFNRHQDYRRWMLAHGQPVDAPMRLLTLGECRAICSFPLDFVLTGNYHHRWLRLGMSVPPNMTRAVAERVAEAIGG